ncbi:MAG TPA: ROK family protein, partial [Phnomibacter sp.]|nr:ROK family protein [Phnomibacter sp.]
MEISFHLFMSDTPQALQVFVDDDSSGVAYKNKALKRQAIHYLDSLGSATITDVSQNLGISIPKTTSLINELIADGLLAEQGKIDSTGGRRASLVGLVAHSCYFLGVDVRPYFVNIGLLDFKKNMVKVEEHVPFTLSNSLASYEQLVKIINDFVAGLPIEKSLIISAGINLSGRINHHTGYSYSYFHFQEAPLSESFSRDTGITCFIENDSRAMAYGEFFGAGPVEVRNAL